MKKWVGIAVLSGMMAGTGWAQESCHWDDLDKGFYRVIGTHDSDIVSIFPADGMFVWANATTNGSATVEANYDMGTTNWIRQEHLSFSKMIDFQSVQVTEPSCVPRTGQTNSLAPGDDGDLQPGHNWANPRFTVQADTNLVVDNQTGLMWMSLSLGPTDWDTAVNFCFTNDILGHADWRLPSVRELESLLDLGKATPALPDSHVFRRLGANYWSSTGDSVDTNKAWVIGIQEGTIARWNRTNSAAMFWMVRTHTFGPVPVPKTGQTNYLVPGDDGWLQPGQPWPIPRFTVMADTNLVFDNLVGRMWTRQVGIDATTSWALAVDYCHTLDFGDYTDWRLPTRREVWSLIDFGSTNYLPDGHPFIGEPDVPFWCSTSYRPFPTNYAWGINGGHLGAYLKTSMGGGVWPIRGDW
jgi:Protein of unknown function (DUF1566)